MHLLCLILCPFFPRGAFNPALRPTQKPSVENTPEECNVAPVHTHTHERTNEWCNEKMHQSRKFLRTFSVPAHALYLLGCADKAG